VGIALVLFFVTWAAIAARPWQERSARKVDPRVTALAVREKKLRHRAAVIQSKLKRDWAVYQQQLQVRQSEIAGAELRHRQELAAAAAAAAAARAAAAASQTVTTTTTTVSAPTRTPKKTLRPASARSGSEQPPPEAAPAPAPPPPPPPPPVVRVVELPPEVQVVQLPPITSSSGS
jgi:hypothetical protein